MSTANNRSFVLPVKHCCWPSVAANMFFKPWQSGTSAAITWWNRLEFQWSDQRSNFCCTYDKIRREAKKIADATVIWNKTLDVVNSSDLDMVWFTQTLRNKTTATLKSTASSLYAVKAVLMNFTYSFRRWPIKTRHTVVCFFPVNRITKIFKTTRSHHNNPHGRFTGSTVVEIVDRKVLPDEITT